MSLDLEAIKARHKATENVWFGDSEDAVADIPALIAEVERLSTPPRGYPECTSAIIEAMDQKDGDVLIRMMHANEELIERFRLDLIELGMACETAIEDTIRRPMGVVPDSAVEALKLIRSDAQRHPRPGRGPAK